eukprot:TRINITY_DN49562_c0_g1_i1.p1 TRINITY_DN49562_c0_g1~~TRINITY_DN49562_c0_g1_i1.p1  ORF type:complete len:1071 (-),score=125.24 TRINITY_DN49562_c0_g1_i1:105-3317(-)
MPLTSAAAAVGSAGKAVLDAVSSVGFAGAVGGGAAAAAEVFSYNRENYMEDREMRMKKELTERKMRIKQAQLWREDVRDFVSLTERKMKYYLLINVLLLGFNVNLWCEGRLPEHTPHWLMLGYQVSTAGSFLFLLLTVWLSMHASVAAQSYQARVLTQLVRLPIPTWSEVEACRTFGSSFEQIDPKQMFRVPFVSGSQEDIATRYAAASPADRTEAGTVDATPVDARSGHGVGSSDNSNDAKSKVAERTHAASVAADPWGLERRGDDIYELGPRDAKETAQLRHIKVIRQAAVYWQTYDAFARVSMSVGVNQLMLAMCYYILGYVLCQVHCPAAAFAGVSVLIATAEMVARIDLTLKPAQQRLIQALLVAGPTIGSIAAYNSTLGYDQADAISRSLAPLAFLSHGAVLALMTSFLGVSEQENGAMLPLAFQGVLFLDVFGWVKDSVGVASEKKVARVSETSRVASRHLQSAATAPAYDAGSNESLIKSIVSDYYEVLAKLESANSHDSTPPKSKGAAQDALGYYAVDYFAGSEETDEMSEGDVEDAQNPPELGGDSQRPAADSVSCSSGGTPHPTRPDDFRPSGAFQDMRHLKGAPRMTDTICAVRPPAKDFFEPVTFMPPEGRFRRKVDEFFDNEINAGFEYVKDGNSSSHIVTGHDHESPGVLPWHIFKGSSALLCIVWACAGAVAILDNLQEHSFTISATGAPAAVQNDKLAIFPSLVGLWASGLSGISWGPKPERIVVTWPYHAISPWGLSCDSAGRQLLVTDGVSTLTASLQLGDSSVSSSGRLRAGRQVALDSRSGSTETRADFHEVSLCDALHGEAITDTALFCPRADNASFHNRACMAAVLHQRGKRVAYCSLPSDARDAIGEPVAASYAISQTWLDGAETKLPGVGGDRLEKVEWILGDSDCTLSPGTIRDGGTCISVGTSHGRVARLRQDQMAFAEREYGSQFEPKMAPDDIAVERKEDWEIQDEDRSSSVAGVVRAFNSRYIGVLQPKRKSIRVLDLSSSGSKAATLMLPAITAKGAGDMVSFCSGGGHLYMLGSGPSPGLWRMSLPAGLHSDSARGIV